MVSVMTEYYFVTEKIRNDLFDILTDCIAKKVPVRIPFNAYVREQRFNSRIRRDVSDFFYEAVRFWGAFKKNHLQFSPTEVRSTLASSGVDNSFLTEICGFEPEIGAKLLAVMDSDDQVRSLYDRAPMTIRVNSLKSSRADLLKRLKSSYDAAPTVHSPVGVIFDTHINVRELKAFKQGLFEIQDEGSQLISLLTPVEPKERLLDYCAGSGGKTLALYARLNGDVQIDAHDISEGRLKQLQVRATKVGANVSVVKKPVDATYDTVLVDAPCSGTGSIRRDPDLHLRLDAERLNELVSLQRDVFEKAVRTVKPGGMIFYVTCSFLKEENESQVEYFKATHPELSIVPIDDMVDPEMATAFGISTFFKTGPWLNGMDGFFGAVFKKQ